MTQITSEAVKPAYFEIVDAEDGEVILYVHHYNNDITAIPLSSDQAALNHIATNYGCKPVEFKSATNTE